jgi:uncharacterized membrane protein
VCKPALLNLPPYTQTLKTSVQAVRAGVILTGVAMGLQGNVLRRKHVPVVAGLGLCLFLNQLLFILGLQLGGVTLAACMQPAIPVFTSFLSMLVGQEHMSAKNVCGAVLAQMLCCIDRFSSTSALHVPVHKGMTCMMCVRRMHDLRTSSPQKVQQSLQQVQQRQSA